MVDCDSLAIVVLYRAAQESLASFATLDSLQHSGSVKVFFVEDWFVPGPDSIPIWNTHTFSVFKSLPLRFLREHENGRIRIWQQLLQRDPDEQVNRSITSVLVRLRLPVDQGLKPFFRYRGEAVIEEIREFLSPVGVLLWMLGANRDKIKTTAAGHFFGVSRKTIVNWSNSGRQIPHSPNGLLKCVVAAVKVCKMAGLEDRLAPAWHLITEALRNDSLQFDDAPGKIIEYLRMQIRDDPWSLLCEAAMLRRPSTGYVPTKVLMTMVLIQAMGSSLAKSYREMQQIIANCCRAAQL